MVPAAPPSAKSPEAIQTPSGVCPRSKSIDVFLNGALMQDPDLVNNLIGVIIRFRKEQV